MCRRNGVNLDALSVETLAPGVCGFGWSRGKFQVFNLLACDSYAPEVDLRPWCELPETRLGSSGDISTTWVMVAEVVNERRLALCLNCRARFVQVANGRVSAGDHQRNVVL